MQHGDFYELFRQFFWLIFPIGCGVIAMFGLWLHHRRALQALEVIQAYAAQGKEAPPEVMALIQSRRREKSPAERAQTMTLVAYILLAMAVGFAVMTAAIGGSARELAGMYFVVVLFAGVAAAFFIAARSARHGQADPH